MHRDEISLLQSNLNVQYLAGVSSLVRFHSRSERVGIAVEIRVVVTKLDAYVSLVCATNIASYDTRQEIDGCVFERSRFQ